MIEKRKHLVSENQAEQGPKGVSLPHDYLEMVEQIFRSNFDEGLKAIANLGDSVSLRASGEVFSDEIVLGVTLEFENQLSATSIYASVDFDPHASSPTAEDLLGNCVDAIGSICADLLDARNPDKLKQLSGNSLSELEGVPFLWQSFTFNKREVFLKVDKSNPRLDKMADDWLAENDPLEKEKLEKEKREAESLFVTGPKKESS